MPIRIGRIVIIAVAVEAITILTLVVVVALAGPPDPQAAQAYAEKVGYWLGPMAGFFLCVAGGWLAARSQSTHHVLNGLVLGATVAVIDVALLVANGAEFQLIFVASNIGRLAAGSIGGWFASRGAAVRRNILP